MRWITNHFQFTKFSLIDFVLTDRGSLSGKRPKLASEKSSSCRFSFSAERTANTKAAEYVIQWISQQPPKSSEFSVSRHIYRKANPPHHRSLPFSVSGQHWNQSLAPFFFKLTVWILFLYSSFVARRGWYIRLLRIKILSIVEQRWQPQSISLTEHGEA